MNKVFFRLIVSMFLVFFTSAFTLDNKGNGKVKEEILTALQKWPKEFNAKNIPEVCGLFAPDLVASYPGTKDRNYKDMCDHLTSILKETKKIFRYEAPEIEQVIIEGDLAVVRLIWILRVLEEDQSKETFIKEKGLDVLTRQPDGSWKISISYAYPIEG